MTSKDQPKRSGRPADGSSRRTPRNRLPHHVDLPSRGAEIALGVLALFATMLIVVGLPIALFTAFGPPWPSEAPTMEWLSQPMSGETVMAVLAGVVWLAWLHFVICLVVEAHAERRHRGLAPRVPGGGIGTQQLARRAIATIALIAGATAASVSTATASGVGSNPPPVASEVSQAAVAATVEAVNVSQQAAAEAAVSDGTLPSGDSLLVANATDQAQAATTYYEVNPPRGRHYDTLWDISERYLGDGLRYREIWELNKGVQQPDGRVLRDADLIYPGWVMKMPADAKGPGLKVLDHVTPAPVPGAPSTEPGAAPSGPDDLLTEVAEESGVGGVAGGGSGMFNAAIAPVFGVAGGLVVAGAALALRRRRASETFAGLWASRQQNPTPRNPTDPAPNPPGGGPGAALASEADVPAAEWLNQALRSWNHSGPVPAPSSASLGSAGMAVGFEFPLQRPLPEGWTQSSDKVWTISRDVAPFAAGLSPVPGLVTVGRRDDGTSALIDPESVAGVVSLEGPAEIARGVALSMAVDTATHPWADDRVVTLVNFADDMSNIGHGRIKHANDLGRVLDNLVNLADYHRGACRAAGVATARTARQKSPHATRWSYHLVICSGLPSEGQLTQLQALAADPHVALGVVVVGSVPDSKMRLTVRPDGRLVSPMHGLDVAAQIFTPGAARDLSKLYESPVNARSVSLDQLVDVMDSENRDAAAASSNATVRLEVLGPISLHAAGEVDQDRKDLLTELATFIAVNPGGVHANRISAALWPRGVEPAIRDAAIKALGTWLGSTSTEDPVLVNRYGVWSFAPGSVAFDWDEFRDRLNRAASDGPRREQHLRTALDLVRGLAFEGAPEGRWAWLDGTNLPNDIPLAIGLTAQALAEAAAAREDFDSASAALDHGLQLLPASEELWRAKLQLVQHFGERSDMEQVATAMYAAIAEHGSLVGASSTTDSLVDELLPGFRSKVA